MLLPMIYLKSLIISLLDISRWYGNQDKRFAKHLSRRPKFGYWEKATHWHPREFVSLNTVRKRMKWVNIFFWYHWLVKEKFTTTVVPHCYPSPKCVISRIFDKSIKNCVKYLRFKGHQLTFLPEEIELEAMIVQLKNKGMTNGRYKYNAGGVICAVDFSHLEIWLTEVSSKYVSSDTGKVCFDHYKAMLGILAMMRTIAQKYNKGTFDTFRKLKVRFLHGYGRQ